MFFLVLSYRQQIPFGRNIITILVLFTIFSLSSFKVFQQNIIIDNEKDWLNFFDVEIDQLINNKELVFLDITADWCATCQFNKLNVLNSASVIQLFKDNKVSPSDMNGFLRILYQMSQKEAPIAYENPTHLAYQNFMKDFDIDPSERTKLEEE